MKSFNVTMPEELLAYVRSRTKEGGFGTPTEFMRHLIRKDRDDEVTAEKRKQGRGGKATRSTARR